MEWTFLGPPNTANDDSLIGCGSISSKLQTVCLVWALQYIFWFLTFIKRLSVEALKSNECGLVCRKMLSQILHLFPGSIFGQSDWTFQGFANLLAEDDELLIGLF